MRASAISSTDVLFADSTHWEKKGVFFGYFLCTSKESDPRYSIAEALALKKTSTKAQRAETRKSPSHTKHPKPLPLNRRIERRRNRQPKHAPRIERINHAIIPKPRRRIVGLP